LFLGAGSSIQAGAPSAEIVKDELSNKYLDGQHQDKKLSKVSSYIQSKPGLGRLKVIQYLQNRLDALQPSSAHLTIPDFSWAAIYTTNYDRLLERVYEIKQIRYKPVISNQDLIPDDVGQKRVLIYKPHGCIARPESLVITDDDYYDFAKSRDVIYRQLELHKYTNTFLFIGYSFSDYNLTKIWYDVFKETGNLSLWSYALWPGFTEEEMNYWKDKNVILIDATFEQFMHELSIYKSKLLLKKNVDADENENDVLKALLTCLEMKSPLKYNQSIRAAEISLLIAEELSLSASKKNIIKKAALLQNIGYMKIPDSIINKPNHMTQPEYEAIKQHPETGEKITASFSELKDLSVIIRSHHEWLNGDGYPYGLKEESIPFESRIITVADVIVAMLHNQPYRPKVQTQRVLDELDRMAGSQFDKDIVEAVHSLYEKGKIVSS